MAATLDKETFQRLTLLYLIGLFPKGVFSSFRLQTVLYFATRDVEPKPFTFRHTRYGQYSHGVAAQLTLLLEAEMLLHKQLPGQQEGSHWQTSDVVDHETVRRHMNKGFPQLVQAIRCAMRDHAFLELAELNARADADPAMKATPPEEVLLRAPAGLSVPTLLDEDDAEDLALVLYPGFQRALKNLALAMIERDLLESESEATAIGASV